ncbi:MAG: hypothetical protein QGH15_07415 [Kiritimatiellia bacterium]|jgi:hypothetical protein|nr:hypothetical protein [Kiritimatiellia bacterium]
MRETRQLKSTSVITATMTVLFLILTAVCSTGRVPPPSETPAKIIINGRTSTAVDIKIVKVGQELPDTLSAPKIKSIRGYDWYVSEHFALRSEVDEKQSRDYLTISELAYPHYVWIFGGEPAGIETKRIALSFSKSMERLKKASDIDFDGVGWRGGGGGVTLHGNRVSYNYPGGGLRSHKRGLVMHENLHAFHMHRADRSSDDLPVWFYEGITHALEQHVYDPEKRQLTILVLDRLSGNNYTDSGLADLRKDFVEAEQFWLGKEGMGYEPDIYQLWMQFLWSDLDRQMRHRVWLNERMALDLSISRADFDKAIMPQLFDVPALNKAWREWVAERQNTFHYVDWGFEQEADTLWSYGYPNWARYAQKNVNLLLKDKVETADPFIMDWPIYASKPPIVGEVKRGVREPSVGCVINFSRAMHYSGDWGQAGLGFGVGGTGKRESGNKSNVDQEHLDILIMHLGKKDRAHLLLDGSTIGLPRTTEPFTPAFQSAAVTGDQSIGLTVKMTSGSVDIVLRTGPDDAIQTHRTSVAITQETRERILSKPWCILSKGTHHGFTLFPDVHRVGTRDYSKPGPVGRTRFLPTDETYRLYRAAWRLGDQAPRSLLALRADMIACAARSLGAHEKALAKFHTEIADVAKDVAEGPDRERAALAVADLLGLDLQFNVEAGAEAGDVVLTSLVSSRLRGALKGQVALTVSPAKPGLLSGSPAPIVVSATEDAGKTWKLEIAGREQSFMEFTVTATLAWNGMTARVKKNQRLYPSVSRWWTLGPFDNKGDGTVDTVLPPETEPIDLAKSYAGKGGKRIAWQKREWPATLQPTSNFVLNFGDNRNSAAYALTWIDSPTARDAILAVGSDDGVVVWLNDERVHANLVHRGHESKSDKIPVKLKTGRNKLLLKVTQAWGGWLASTHVLDKDGNELADLSYVLDPDN